MSCNLASIRFAFGIQEWKPTTTVSVVLWRPPKSKPLSPADIVVSQAFLLPRELMTNPASGGLSAALARASPTSIRRPTARISTSPIKLSQSELPEQKEPSETNDHNNVPRYPK